MNGPRVPSVVPEGLLCAATVFGPFAFGCVEPWSRAALEILCFALALSCVLRGARAQSKIGARFWLFPAGFAAWGLLQSLVPAAADAPRPALPFTVAVDATRSSALLWTAYAALLWSVPRVLVTHQAARRYARLVVGVAVALAALGLAQSATGTESLYWLRAAPRTFFASYYNRDHAANILIMALGLAVGLAFARRSGEDAVPQEADRRLIPAGAAVFLSIAIGVTRARAAVLALPLAAVVLTLLGAGFQGDARRRRLWIAGALAAGVLVVALAYRHVVETADAGALVEHNIMGRLSIYGDARRWLRDAPLFGTGLGTFAAVYPSYQDLDLTAVAEQAHSDWLQLALEAGVLGLLAALAAAALAAGVGARSWRSARSREMRALIGGALAAAAAFCGHVLFEFAFQIPGNAVVFLSIVGLLLSASAWKDKAEERRRPEPASDLTAFASLVVFAFLSWRAALPAAAQRAAGQASGFAARAAAFEQAYALDADPRYLERRAKALYGAAEDGGRGRFGFLRAGLEASLAAADARPFDAEALSLAGMGLARLRRPADAAAFYARATTVRFTPTQGRRASRR
jgi:O-antigen ligase